MLENETNDSVFITLDEAIQNWLSQMYPEALKYKDQIKNDVIVMLRQMPMIEINSMHTPLTQNSKLLSVSIRLTSMVSTKGQLKAIEYFIESKHV